MVCLVGRGALVAVVCVLLSACGSDGSSSAGSASNQAYSLSGRVFIEPESDVDLDVERRYNLSLEARNDSIETAQVLSNPATVGGYLSGTSGEYYEDAFGNTGTIPVPFEADIQDVYSVELLSGQQVMLSVFRANDLGTTQGDTVDLTLAVYEAEDATTKGSLVAARSFDSEVTKGVSVDADGRYFIELVARTNVATPVLYTLAIGQSSNVSSAARPQINAPFVPGEVIVQFKETPQLQGLSQARQSKRAGNANSNVGMQELKSIGQLARHYRFDEQRMNSALAFEQRANAGALSARQQKKWQTLELIKALRARDDVLYAEPNYLFTATAAPNDPAYRLQWNLPMLELPSAWDRSTGLNAVVAVVDTGIDANHVDFGDNISSDGYDFIVSTSLSGDGNGPDSNPNDEGDSFHGAHVAGIVAAQGNNGIGIAGVAYDATIMPLRALGIDGTGTLADISNAILYAAGLSSTAPAPPSQRADVINLSLGISETDLRMENGQLGGQTMQNAINAALGQGVIIVAAAGNASSSVPNYPAAYEGVVAVSSVNDRRTKSNFSNYGDYIDVAAPGGTSYGSPYYDGFQDGILSTIYANEYTELVGTSMATPHVAGVAALMKSVDPTLNNVRFMEALNSGEITDNLGTPLFYGNGLINAAKALTWLGESIDTALNVFPRQLNFSGANTSGILYLSNPGAGAVTVTGVTSEATWLEVNPRPGAVNGAGLGDYALTINVSAAPQNGTTNVRITYEVDGVPAEDRVVPVYIAQTVVEDDTVGALYVYLLRKEDVDGAEPEAAISVFASVNAVKGNGAYTYTFPAVPPGQYFLEASTDNDGDFFVFDAGEAKGAYPLLYESELISITNQNLRDRDFDVAYLRFVSGSELGSSASSTQSAGSRPTMKRRLQSGGPR